ncbi:hypothetical protein JR316_0001172 [Psilocybe cubensis]|uniref:RING-type domain-containing protein n=2 Tax=Psilocybe cubensis TaxID=181762 RepID=A0A8H7YBT8_PSICU|nr:hypothetical protein JR316_0001172 [Psilocybe cubensis]KAH9487104.1 hypothetical protein JR316_0001172 [Psilocybe cubensis]
MDPLFISPTMTWMQLSWLNSTRSNKELYKNLKWRLLPGYRIETFLKSMVLASPRPLPQPQEQLWRYNPNCNVYQTHERPIILRVRSSPQKRKKTDAESQLKEHIEQGSTLPTKRERSDDDVEIISPKRKGKMKADNEMRQILSSYEDELTCPICFDIFVASHVGNPCGHTFCGDCGWQWHVQNKKKACPFCRIDLAESMPMIPNIAMDNTVEKHIKALASSGVREWEPGGQKFREWDARKQAWHNGMAKREQQKKISRRAYKPPPVTTQTMWIAMTDSFQDLSSELADGDDIEDFGIVLTIMNANLNDVIISTLYFGGQSTKTSRDWVYPSRHSPVLSI